MDVTVRFIEPHGLVLSQGQSEGMLKCVLKLRLYEKHNNVTMHV